VSDLKGSCYGAVGFRATGPSKWCGHCHCTICQRVHGSGVVTWVGFEEGDVVLDDPQGALQWFESSPGAGRGACSGCGSHLFFRSEKWPGELHIVRAAFTSEVDRAPEGQAFFDTRVDWLSMEGAPD